jgi:hypothetical protein
MAHRTSAQKGIEFRSFGERLSKDMGLRFLPENRRLLRFAPKARLTNGGRTTCAERPCKRGWTRDFSAWRRVSISLTRSSREARRSLAKPRHRPGTRVDPTMAPVEDGYTVTIWRPRACPLPRRVCIDRVGFSRESGNISAFLYNNNEPDYRRSGSSGLKRIGAIRRRGGTCGDIRSVRIGNRNHGGVRRE